MCVCVCLIEDDPFPHHHERDGCPSAFGANASPSDQIFFQSFVTWHDEHTKTFFDQPRFVCPRMVTRHKNLKRFRNFLGHEEKFSPPVGKFHRDIFRMTKTFERDEKFLDGSRKVSSLQEKFRRLFEKSS